jgi:hypothetical protein
METKYFQLAKYVDLQSNIIKLNVFLPLELETYAVVFLGGN